jgi:FtsP/CotA-like multicopper oxidase with cupredoxin domain
MRVQPIAGIALGVAVLSLAGGAAAQQRTPAAARPAAYEAPAVAPDLPERPWARAARQWPEPGKPGRDYTPAVVPNGETLDYRVVDGVKVFHLTAEPVRHEVADGLVINTWGYNGRVPGPLIEVAEGDRVRIYVTNRLPRQTTVHWHGVLLPCGMDGVSGLTQPPIPPGETYVYEFIFPDAGTFMYHPHFDGMTQEGMGLTGMILVHRRQPPGERPDRDFAIMLHEWSVAAGTGRPNPNEMTDFNVLTMNGRAMPGTEPLIAALGDRVWIRFGNLSAMDHHPIHLHGYAFKVIGTDGGWAADKDKLLPLTTVLVQVGSAKVVEFVADNPGDWLFHCHMTHHTMNQMGHDFPNMIGVDASGLDARIQRMIPGYMTMGTAGMMDMTRTGMPLPDNSIPMRGARFQFGQTIMGGMANVLRVREGLETYDDPGPYEFPEGTVSYRATPEQMRADGIEPPPAEMPAEQQDMHDRHMHQGGMHGQEME